MHSPNTVHNRGSETESVLGGIGATPLVRLSRIDAVFDNVSLYAKLEVANPGGSVKDRPALEMVQAAEREGRLPPGGEILDASSGNTGIALAMIAARRGYRLRLAIPANAGLERLRTLRAYGARLVLTDAALGIDGAVDEARRIHDRLGGRIVYFNQYDNPDNWGAHYRGTGPEIWRQSAGCLTHFVAALGTGGTFVGTSRCLKSRRETIECVSVQPDGPFHGIEGMKHMPTARKPGIYDPSLADRNIEIATERAYHMVRRLAREEGLFVGVSSGAAMAASLDVARDLESKRRAMIVTVFPDGGDKYLSERFWDEHIY